MSNFTLTAGVDTFTGTPGQRNTFFFTASTLQSTDSITGGATGGFIDVLSVTAGGAIAASQFAGVTNVEELDLAAAGNSITLTNGLVAGSSTGQFTIVDGGGTDNVDGSAISNGMGLVFQVGGGDDTLKGGSGNDIFFIAPADLNSNDTFVGGSGVDTIWFTAGGGVPASAFTNASGIEALVLGGAGNTVTLSNQLVGGSDNGQFVVTSLGGDNTADASGVTSTNAIIFNAGSGTDTLKGGAGNDAFVFSTVSDLTSSDVVIGGAGVDTIWLNGAGTVAAGAFAGVSGFEALVLSSGGNNVTLTNGLVAGTSNGTFAIGDRGGNDVVDASGVTNNVPILFFAAGGNDSFTGGNGGDAFVFASADLTSGDTLQGGAGTDNLFILTGGTLAASAFTHVSGIEALVLYGSDTNVTLTDAAVSGTSIGVFNIADGVGNDVIDASASVNTPIAFYAQTGNDTFRGGSGSDGFIISAANLTAGDTMVGGAGFDVLSITTNGTVTAANNAGVSQIEAVQLLVGGEFDLANTLSTTALTGLGTAAVDKFDGTLVTNYTLTLIGNGGADTLIGGSKDDTIIVPDGSFASLDGRGGNDTVVLTTSGQTFDVSANASKMHNIEVLNLDNTASTSIAVSITGADVTAITANNILYVVGSADDSILIDTGFTLVGSNITNNSIASTVGYTFDHWHNVNGADLYIAQDVATALAAGGPPNVGLGGNPAIPAEQNFAANYTTGDSAGAAIAAPIATLDDPDSSGLDALIATLDVAISDPHSGAAEFLKINAAGHTFLSSHPELTVTGENTQTLHISGNAPDTVYQTLLRDIVYVNTDISASLNTSDRHITVDAKDGVGHPANERTTTISLSNGDHAPVASPVTLTAISEDSGAHVISATELLTGVTDVDGQTLTITSLSIATGGGSLANNGGGIWTYTPALNDDTGVTFNYTASDGLRMSSSTATLDITPVNDAPVTTVPGAQIATEDTSLAISGVSVTDVDSSVAVTLSVGHGVLNVTGAGVTGNGSGSVTIASNSPTAMNAILASLTYKGDANFHGNDTLTVIASDGLVSNTGAVAITVNAVNDNPVAVADTTSTNEDNAVTYNVLVNDSDVDGDSLSVTSATVQGGAAVGTVVINPDKTITFTPATNSSGPAVIDYTINDGHGGTASSTLSVTVNPVNDAPVAVFDTVNGTEDTPVTFDVRSNDTDVDGPFPLNVIQINGTAISTGSPVTLPDGAQVALNADGTLTYTPFLNANGSRGFNYTVSDGTASSVGNVTVNLASVNDAPVANDNGTLASPIAIVEDTPTSINVLANDTDVDGPGSLAIASVNGTTITTNGQTVAVAGGTVSVNTGNGVLTFTPTANSNGASSFTYVAKDGLGATSGPATVFINVTPVNDAPVAVADSFTTDEDTTLNNLSVLDNDTDIEDGTPVAVARINGTAIAVNGTVGVIGGAVTLRANQTLTFTPNPDANGDMSFTYTARDSSGAESGQATVTIHVNAVNDAPVAAPNTFSTAEDTPFTINVLANDSDVESGKPNLISQVAGQAIVVGGTVAVTGGIVKLNPDQTLTFTPNADFNGTGLSFTYVAKDVIGGLESNTATVNYSVTAVNDAPVAVSDVVNGAEDTPVTFDVRTNDTDVDGPFPLQVTQINGFAISVGSPVTLTDGAQVALNANGTLTYTPVLNANGSRAFTYTLSDGTASSVGNVTVNLAAVNDNPVVDLNGGSAGIDRSDVPAYTSGATEINVASAIASVTDVDNAISKITLHLTADSGVTDGTGTEGLTLPGGAAAFLTSIGFTVSGEGTDNLEIAANAPGGVSPSVFEGILKTVLYHDNDTTFSFNPEDRSIAVTATDAAGGVSSAALVHIDLAANVTDVNGASALDHFVGANLADTIRGNGGDDTMEGRGGNDTIYGGTEAGDAGHDTAVFTGDRADYTVTRTGSGVYTVADSVPSRDGTDTVHDVETLHFNGSNTDLLLDAPIQVFDASDNVLLASFQANQLDLAVNYANSHAGANVIELQSSSSPFTASTWPLDVTEAVTIKAVGGTATVNAGSHSGFTIEPGAVLGASDVVRLEGLNITGDGTTPDTVGVLFNGSYEGLSDGAIQLVATSASGFGQDGVAIIGGGSGLTVTIDGDNPNLAGIQTATFTGSGHHASSGGTGDLLFFDFTGAAALKNLSVIGTTGTGAGAADNGIQFAGFDGTDHSVDHAIGVVTFDNVTVSGTYEKTLVYVQGYDNYNGLSFASGLALGGAGSQTTWTGLFIDGGPQGGAYIPDATSTLNLTGVSVNGGTYGTSPSFAALGSKPIVVNGVVTGDIITGTNAAEAFIGSTGDDTINAGGGSDLVVYDVGDGHDTVDGQGGTDTLALINFTAGAPSATSATFTVAESGGHLIVNTDGGGTAEVDALGMESLQVQLGNGGDTVTLTGNIAGAGISTGAGGIVIAGGNGADTIDASGLTSANAIAFSNLNTGDDTFKAANVVANDQVDGGTGGETLGDTADYSAASAAVTIDLAGTASGTSVGNDIITNFENAKGGAGDDNITGTSGANTLSGGGGDDTITGKGGTDTIHGGGGNDTAHFDGSYASAVITWNGTTATVSTAPDGTDTIDGVGKLTFGGDSKTVWLVGSNSDYTTVSQLFDGNAANGEVADGDIILLASGETFAENVTVSKSVTVLGAANHGTPGTAALRGAESVLTGHWSVTAAGTVIDGVKFLNDAPYVSGSNDTRLILAASATVENSIFYNTRSGGDKPISDIAINVTATSGAVAVTGNYFTGDSHGKYFAASNGSGNDFVNAASWGGGSTASGPAGAIVWGGGSTLDVNHNTIQYARSALTVAGNDSLLSVDHNTIDTSGTGITATGWQGPVTGITNNTFTNVDNEINDRFEANGVNIDLGSNTSDVNFSFFAGRGDDTIAGTAGADSIITNQGNDTVHAGAGDDLIFINAGTGNDLVDGGAHTVKDTLIVSNVQISGGSGNDLNPGDANDPTTATSGNPSNTAVTFTMTPTGDVVTPTSGSNHLSDILVTMATTAGASPLGQVSADEIEDVRFNLGNGGDTVNISGDFSATSLSPNTITVTGGNGADTVDARNLTSADHIVFNGGGGNDTFDYAVGTGVDSFDGGDATDTLNVFGKDGGNDTIHVTVNGSGAITVIEGMSPAAVEVYNADGRAGNDTLDYSGSGANAVNVNLTTGNATGFASISNIENAVGTSGNDTFTSAASGSNTFTGGNGDDTYNLKAGDHVVEANGNAGGIDAVFTKDSFTLEASVENLTLLENGVSNTQTFDGMALGAITNGENGVNASDTAGTNGLGWKVAGSHDQEIVDRGGGNFAFRMSSDPTSGDFGGPYSPELSAAAGEIGAGAAFDGQSIRFNFQAVHAAPDGSRLEVDFGNAAGTDRNNFLVIESSATTGIRIAVSEPDLSGNFSGNDTDPAPNDWRELVTGVDPSAQHTLEMRLAYVDGANNDRIDIYLDGQYIGQTTTFENYHDSLNANHNANAAANFTDRVFFRGGANGSPQDGPGGALDAGFYFDNLTTSVYNNTSGTGNGLANVITGNSGDNLLTGLGGDDTLNGGLGIDTAAYQDARSNYAITVSTDSHGRVTGFSQVQETGAPGLVAEGTDTLTSIERLQFSDARLDVNQKVQLFDSTDHLIGTFDHIQDAINAGADGYRIRLAAGSYDENVDISKNIEIDGVNAGTAGTGSRGAESVIRGQVTVSAAHSATNHVTVNGVEVYNTSDNTHPFVGIQVNTAADVTVTNSVFYSPVINGSNSIVDRAVLLTTAATGIITIDHNLFTGAAHSLFGSASWTTAIWSDGREAAGSSIDHNTFEWVRTAINADDFNNGLAIANNIFQNAGSGISIGGAGGGVNADVANITSIAHNTFNNVDTDFNLQNITAPGKPIGLDLTATDNHATNPSDPVTVLGGASGDTLKGSAGIDVLTGNGGNDILVGNAGNDILVGGIGTDTVDYSQESGGGAVVVNLATGTATDTFGNTDTLSGIENAIGTSGADTFTSASTGVNTFTGGLGNDTYNVKAGDVIVELNGNTNGIDQVFTTDSFTLDANVENLTLQDKTGTHLSDTQTFDNMTLGPITDGENGWKVAGSHDQEIVDRGGGNFAFRMSSDPTSGDFGGPYSPELSAAAGEIGAGAAFDGQSIRFNFQAVHAAPDGSRLEVDFGNAAGTDRNNFLVIESSATTGIRIAVSEPDLSGNFSGNDTDPAPNDWRELVTGVDPSAQHTLEMRLAYVDGANNDRIDIYLDGQYIGQTTTFENYHDSLNANHNANAAANFTDRVFFRGGANGSPQDGPGGALDAGFYFDNLTTSVYNNTSGTGNGLANVITGNSGDNLLTGLGGDDTLNGGLGIDTAAYQDARSNYAITVSTDSHGRVTGFSQVQETGAPGLVAEGTDTLTSIERLQFSDARLDVNQKVQLFDSTDHLIGTFDHIQDAINAGADGYIVRLAAGTYNELVDLNKDITILGANSGIAGTGVRGAESVLLGGVLIEANGATLDGVEVNGSHDFAGVPDHAAVYVTANGVTIQNSLLQGSGPSSGFGVITAGGLTGLSINNDHFAGYDVATYIVAGTAGSITGNLFDGSNGNAVNTESQSTTVTGNTINQTLGGEIQVLSADPTVDASAFVHGNTYTGSHAHPVQIYPNYTGGAAVITGTELGDTLNGDLVAGPGPFTFNGLAGNDSAYGSANGDNFNGGAGNDTFFGNAGNDTATYDDAASHYTVGVTTTNGIVTAFTTVQETAANKGAVDEGTDTLDSIERLAFSDTTLDLTQAVQLFDNSGKLIGTFDHIQDAVNAADNSGETVRVKNGTYTEQVTVGAGKTGLSIIGESKAGVIIKAPAVLGVTGTSDHFSGDAVRANVTVTGVTGVTIQKLTVDGSFAGDSTPGSNGDEISGIAYLHASGTVDSVVVKNVSNSTGGGLFGLQHGDGILVDNGAGAQQSITISNSQVQDFQKTGILVWNANVDVHGNDVEGIGPTSLTAQNAMQIGGSQGIIGGAGALSNTFGSVGYTIGNTTSTDLIVYEPTGALDIINNHLNGTAANTVGIDLTDVASGKLVTIQGNTIGTGGMVDGIDAYTFEHLKGLDSNPSISGNTFVGITGDGIFFDPEFVADAGTFTTTTAFNQTGSQFKDYLHGSSGADMLSSGGGDDSVVWNAGDGNDTIIGGSGGETAGDTLFVAAEGHNLTLTAGTGNFTVSQDDAPVTNTATVSEVEEVDITLSGGETITINGDFTGTGIAQHTITIDGSAGAAGETVNTTTLGAAYPVDIKFTGGTGSDTLVVGTGTHLDFNGGDNTTGTGDTIDFSHVASGIVIDSSGHVSGGATGIVTNIENIIGTSATDRVEFGAGYTVTINNDGSATVSNGSITEHLSGIEQIKVGGTTYDLTQNVRLFDSGNHLIGTFDHIQQGVGAAHASGDTVKVAAGHYQEQVTVDGKSVSIVGAGEGATFIDSPNGNTLVANVIDTASSRQDKYALVGAKNGADLVISGVTIDGRDQGTIPQDTDGLYDFVGIQGVNASINADHVTVTGIRQLDINGIDPSGVQHNTAIIVDNTDAALRTFTLTNSTVTNFQKNALALVGAGLTVNVDHNTVTGAGAITTTAQNGIQVSGGAGGSITHNTLSGIDYVGTQNAIASNILVFGAASGVLVNNNAITGAAGDGDAGIYFVNSDSAAAHGNTLNGLAYGIVDQGTFGTPVDHSTSGADDNTFNPTDANGIAIGFYPDTGAATGYTFTGSASTDDLEGGAGNDNLDGRGGDDFLVGNAGADTLTGGSHGVAGDTVAYVFEAGTAAVKVNLSTAAYGGVAASHATDTFGATDTLSGIENVAADVARYGDTVALDGAFSAWTVTYNATTHAWTATKGSETHVLTGVEQLVFQNGGSPQTVHLVDPGHAGSAYTSAQDAINHAAAGDTVLLAQGTYNETLTTDKALTILGANHGVAGTAGRGAESIINWSTGNAVTVNTTAQVSFDGLKFTGTHVLVETTPDAKIGFSDSVFVLTAAGGSNNNFYLNQPDSFSFTNNKLDATGYTGALFQPVGTTGDPSQTSVTFTGNTFTGHPATYVPGDDNNVPLIINLSDVHGTVSNNTFDSVDIGVLVANGTGPLDITGNTFEHMHRAPATSGGGFAAGVVFFQPAPFGGLVNVSNNTFIDDDAGVRTSAVPGSTVVGSPITIDGNHFTTVTNVGFQPVSGVLHFTNSTVNGPSVPSEFFGGSSDDTITSTAANDIVHGNTGTDTLVLSGNQSDYSIAFDGTTVTVTDNRGGHPDAVDTADHIGKLHFADHNVFLVGTGSDYTTLQSAVTAAAASDTVLLAAGTYNESVTLNKAITILGANHGVHGDGARGSESTIDGGFDITSSDVTLDGLNIINGRVDYGFQRTGVFIDGATANVTIENSIINQTATPHPEGSPAGIETTYGADTPNLQVLHNVIENWDWGMYLNPGVHDATFDGNVFTNNGNHIIIDGLDDLTITNNDFGASDGSKIFANVYDNPTDLEAELGLSGNTFAPDHARLSVAPFGAAGQVVLGTSGDDNFRDDFGAQVAQTMDGRAGNDLLVGDAGNDTLTGGAGNDTVNGGAGTDTATYSGNAADYTVVVSGTSITVTDTRGGSPDGTDTVSTVEELKFADDTVLYVDGTSGSGHYDGAFSTIGAALTAANAIGSGHVTIKVAAGSYNENVNVTRDNVSIVGSGDSTVIHGTFKSANGIADGGVATFLKSGAGYNQAAGAGIVLNADHDSVSSLKIDGFTYGLNFGDGVDFASVSNVSFTDNLVGIKKGTTADISHFSLTGSSITDGLIGIDFDKTTTIGAQADGVANFVTIDGVNFNHLVYKGAYFEALSNAHLTNINMTDVAQFGAPSTSGTAGSGGNGIDLNLKNGTYSNIEIDNFHLTNTGASDRDGADVSGHQNGGAIVVEARDFGSYLNVPGVLTDTVSIHDGTIDGHTSTAIQIGEPGQANLDGPAALISDVSITGAEHDAQHGDIANVTAATTTINMRDGGDSMLASITTTGTMVVNGGTGADAITTGGGNDTIDGGMGSDTVNAGLGNDTVIGTADGVSDVYDGGGDVDTINYSALTTGMNISVSLGSSGLGGASGTAIGSDTVNNFENITSGAGNDSLFGSDVNNIIHGGDGNDNIVGNGGNDTLFGDNGDDTLNGGVNDFGATPAAANDFMTGGLGADTFKFDSRFGNDTVTDWNTGGGASNADTLDFVGYASHLGSLIVTQQGSDVLITVNDGSVDSHVTIQNQIASDFQTTHISTFNGDILIH
jgi:Ca2+-binding RTX toxin-like protein